jgi:NTE family protein
MIPGAIGYFRYYASGRTSEGTGAMIRGGRPRPGKPQLSGRVGCCDAIFIACGSVALGRRSDHRSNAINSSRAKMTKTAFVLAGGGSLGAVQVGMLHALEANGIKPDLVVGSSVGAINAAYYAGAPTAAAIERLRQIWLGLRRADVFPFNFETLLSLVWSRGFLVSSHGLRSLLERHLPHPRLEAARVPLHVVATDLLSGEAVALARGPAADAILASCAIPGAFEPVRLDDRYLVDGAVANNTPIRIAAQIGATRIIVLPIGFGCALERLPRATIATALHAITLLIARQLVSDLESMGSAVEIITVPPLCPLRCSAYDFSQTGELIERAVESTEKWLMSRGLEPGVIPGALRAHHHEPDP